MQRIMRQLSLVYAGGCVGGLLNAIVIWLFGLYGITTAVGVKIAPELDPGFLYHQVIWGGIWGALFLIPLYRNRFIRRGFYYSLAPTAVQLFYVYPVLKNQGLLGFDLGMLTFVFVIIFNAVWGLTASTWSRMAR